VPFSGGCPVCFQRFRHLPAAQLFVHGSEDVRDPDLLRTSFHAVVAGRTGLLLPINLHTFCRSGQYRQRHLAPFPLYLTFSRFHFIIHLVNNIIAANHY
jgi:hypothetical protein